VVSIVVYQGIIANHDKEPFIGNIEIDDSTGLIKKVSQEPSKKVDYEFGSSSIIFPGMGDIHIHAREDDTGRQNYKEDYTTASDAALNGGVVFAAAMPNTPNPLTTIDSFDWHRKRIKQINHQVSMLNYVGIGKGTRPIDKPGVHPYKAFFGKSVGTLTFYDEHDLHKALRFYQGHNISFHVEYEPFVEASKDGNTHSERRPIGAVNHGLKLLLPMIENYGIEAKLCHWSTGGGSLEMIKEHRERSQKMSLPYTTIEVSPLHLIFDTSDTDKDPGLWMKIQMNPAIQGEKHKKALIEGLRDGTIDYIATDHAPHTLEEKYAAFAKFKDDFEGKSNKEIAELMLLLDHNLYVKTCCENNTSGAPWLDTYATVAAWLMRTQNFSTRDIARVTSYNPGRFANQFLKSQYPHQDFGKGFGKIEEGYVGSLTVIDIKKSVHVTKDTLKTKVGWSPLEGRRYVGGLECVVIRGKKIS
jgi:dihydroorotase